MARPALFQAATHALHLDVEPAPPQALLEFSILSRRPERQHPIHPERRVRRGYSAVVIKPSVSRVRKGARAVVHVEQHGIEFSEARTERDRDVTDFHPNALILQRMSRQRPEPATIP